MRFSRSHKVGYLQIRLPHLICLFWLLPHLNFPFLWSAPMPLQPRLSSTDSKGLPLSQHPYNGIPDMSPAFVPVFSAQRRPVWHNWRSPDHTSCLLSIPLQLAVGDDNLAPTIRIALLNARSITNKSLILSELLTRKSLDLCFSLKRGKGKVSCWLLSYWGTSCGPLWRWACCCIQW